MAKGEEGRPMTGDEAALAPFFRAARAEEVILPPALMANILADAAAVTAERRPALPARQPAAARWTVRRLFAPIGGWAGATVLGVSAALGFWIGVAGSVSIDSSGTVQAESSWAADWEQVAAGDDAALDPVTSFYDYAGLVEG